MLDKISSFVGNLAENSDQKEAPTGNNSLEKILANAFKGEDPIAKLSEGIFDNIFAKLKHMLWYIFGTTRDDLRKLQTDVGANTVLQTVTNSIPNLTQAATTKIAELPEWVANIAEKWLSAAVPVATATAILAPKAETNNTSDNPRRGREISTEEARKWVETSKLGENYKIATEFFVKKWLTLQQSIGIVANLHHESNLKINAVGDGWKAKGIAQWHPDRRQAILKATGINVATAPLEKQLEALWWEITKGWEQATYNAIKNAKTEEEAAKQFCILFERPANKHQKAKGRAATANSFMSNMA